VLACFHAGWLGSSAAQPPAFSHWGLTSFDPSHPKCIQQIRTTPEIAIAMLERVLEPELMDTAAEAADYDTMDHSEVNRRFAEDFLSALNAAQLAAGKSIVRILDLGTGTAQIPIQLCRICDSARVVAADAARHMLKIADQNIAAAGFSDRIATQLADAKRLPLADAAFDCVISNSIVHHLPEPMEALREASRVARPGGLLFFRDLLRPDSLTERDRLVDLYAPAAGISPAADHQRAMFSESLHAALTLAEIRDLVVELGFSPDSVQATSDRHWTWSGIKPDKVVG
jgi:ubiquinone/menaquinone biosynthesis C-methylase UbiE